MTKYNEQNKHERNDSKGGSVLVYCITNNLSGKKYVGATKRSLMERYSLNWSKRLLSNPDLRKDVEDLGQKNFKIDVIYKAKTEKQMNRMEKFYIKKLNTVFPNGYNFQLGGSKSEVIVHKETKKRISETMKSSFLPHRGRCSKEMSDCSICGKEIWSYRIRGVLKKTCSKECHSIETSIRMKLVHNKKRKSVAAFDNGKLIKKYASLEETKLDGFNERQVSRAAKRNGTHKGFSWRFT